MKIGKKEIGLDKPVFFIADIGSNHDGDLERAQHLIYTAAEAGADAVKFQNFKAETIVSDYGFNQLGKQSHQADWKESVYETYKKYETPLEWTPILRDTAVIAGVEYLTTPYDLASIDYLSSYVSAWKVGSGDITYDKLIKALAVYDKPLLLSTGASTLEDIDRALMWALKAGADDIVLMQCNTNYTGDVNNLSYINLKVLVGWWIWSGRILTGFSDHTSGHAAVLGAIALAARVIEKHFTDDNSRDGPDHAFAMNPVSFKTMVDRARELELALAGDGIKKVEENERETVILQRRAIRSRVDLAAGTTVSKDDLVCLRPCTHGGLPPYEMDQIVGREVVIDIPQGEIVSLDSLASLWPETDR